LFVTVKATNKNEDLSTWFTLGEIDATLHTSEIQEIFENFSQEYMLK
jgi:hypothetical protein